MSAVAPGLAGMSGEQLRAALRDADLPALLMCVAALTGDTSILTEDIRPDYHNRAGQGGLTPGQQEIARERVSAALRTPPDARARPAAEDAASPGLLCEIIGWAMGDDAAEFMPLLAEELVIDGADPKAPGWRAADLAAGRTFRVAIIGAGMSGLAAAYRLKQAGIDFTVFEKNDGVGGTWFENQYPGCRVDVDNHLYSYSFAAKADWTLHFSTHEVLRRYFEDVSTESGITRHIRFGTEVREAAWDQRRCLWRLIMADGASFECEALISAVGQLNRPFIPDLPGRASYRGTTVHSARWDPSLDLTGQRVAVIGTGASAVQLVPEVAKIAAHVDVLQRTPAWLMPTPNYHDPVAPGMLELFERIPYYAQWYRCWLLMPLLHGALAAATVDPGYPPTEQAVSAANDALRQTLTDYLRRSFAARPGLLPGVVPRYPAGAKRMLRDNGAWPAALMRDNVALVTETIAGIEPEGIRTADGQLHEADVIVYATGFQASEFLHPMKIFGSDGTELADNWSGDARAYLGTTVPRFPNLFLLYGPNTNLAVHGSIIFFSECEVAYVLDALRELLATGGRWMDVRADVHDKYNEEIDAANALRAWGWSGVSTWYKNRFGRSAQNWPFTVLEFWRRTKHVNHDDYAWG
jgi:4-hydroxyacetophenone monooxygenase